MQEPNSVELRLDELSEQLRRIEGRIAVVEERLGIEARNATGHDFTTPPGEDEEDLGLSLNPLLIGRSFMVLGGAFLLRAVTDQPAVADLAGATLGLLYAAFFILLAHRAAARGLLSSATFHGVLAAMIGFPIVFEGRTRFEVFSDPVAAAILVLFTVAELWVAARHKLQSLAWAAVLSVLICAVALIFRTDSLVPYLTVLWLVSLAVLVISRPLGWWALEWWPILFITLLPHVAWKFATGASSLSSGLALMSILMFPLLYLIAYAIRTQHSDGGLRMDEAARLAIAVVFGFLSAGFVAREEPVAAASFLSISAASAGLSYFLMMRLWLREERDGWRIVFYGALAPLFVLLAVMFAPSARGATILLSLAGAGLAVSVWKSIPVLRANALMFGFLAAVFSGLLGYSSTALFHPGSESFAAVSLAAVGVVLLFGMDPLVARPAGEDIAPRLLTGFSMAVFIWILAGLACAAIQLFVSNDDRAILATGRTLSLVALAVALAFIAHYPPFRVAARLVYPIIVGTGLKIAIEDVRAGTPTTLFVTLAAYGIGIIVASRILKWSATRALAVEVGAVLPSKTTA